MTTFAAKPVASAEKLRGGYYTPSEIAAFIASWVAEAGPRVLEPSCGDGRILRELARHSNQVQGVELLPAEAAKARTFAPVSEGDFFTWLSSAPTDWDGVAGNPPYIRFGNWSDEYRNGALDFMRQQGMTPTKLTNAWVPFVVASCVAVRPGGRVGLVIPAELLQVGYAQQLRDFLLSNLSELTLITFDTLQFEGVLQEVVLLCGVAGEGPANIRTVQLSDASQLSDVRLDGPTAPTLLHEHEKWTKYFLDQHHIDQLRRIKGMDSLRTVGEFAGVDVGVVTGRNAFFTFTDAEVRQHGLTRYCVPLVSRSAQLSGTIYDDDSREADIELDHRTWLLNPPIHAVGKVLHAYIEDGVAAKVHEGYKCSKRKVWWKVPSVWVPDGFMLRQIHSGPRITANLTGATSTDTVHRIRLHSDEVSAGQLATAFHNSATFAFAEIMGRSYGGGILELEPAEAERLPIPHPELVDGAFAREIDRLIKSGESEKAREIVDRRILVERLGWTESMVDTCREAWETLRDRRNRRRTVKKA